MSKERTAGGPLSTAYFQCAHLRKKAGRRKAPEETNNGNDIKCLHDLVVETLQSERRERSVLQQKQPMQTSKIGSCRVGMVRISKDSGSSTPRAREQSLNI